MKAIGIPILWRSYGVLCGPEYNRFAPQNIKITINTASVLGIDMFTGYKTTQIVLAIRLLRASALSVICSKNAVNLVRQHFKKTNCFSPGKT